MPKVHQTFRWSKELRQKAETLANKDKRKLCQWIEVRLEEVIERDSKKKK